MKLAAVAVISFFDNVIMQMIVEVDDNATWKDAYAKALSQEIMGDPRQPDPGMDEWIAGMPDDLWEARTEFGNGEMDLCVTFLLGDFIVREL